MFNEYFKMKLLAITETKFASRIIMLKRFSDRWSLYRDDVEKAQFVKEKVLNDIWWDNIDYILAFTNPIYNMIRVIDTDKPTLHLAYDSGIQ